MRVLINDDNCVGCMACVVFCPEIFRDDGDKASLITTSVPAHLKEKCAEAVAECPVEAILMEESSSAEGAEIPSQKLTHSAIETPWYFSENLNKNLKQIVIELPPKIATETKTTMLMLTEQFHHLIVNATATGFYRTDFNPTPILMIRADNYLDYLTNAPLKIGFSFFRTNASGIVAIYVSLDSDALRKKLNKQYPYIEIGYGLDEPKGVQRLKDTFKNDFLTIVLAEKGNVTYNLQNPSTGEFKSYDGPQCKYDMTIKLDPGCKTLLSKELVNILQYHNSIPSSRKNFQLGLNEVWELMPLEGNPILSRQS